MLKKIYIPPELEVVKISFLLDVLSISDGDVNFDDVDNGDGDEFFDDDSNPDSNFDDFDLGDGDGLF